MKTKIICRACGETAEIEEYPRVRFAVCKTQTCENWGLSAMVCNTDLFNDNYKIVGDDTQ